MVDEDEDEEEESGSKLVQLRVSQDRLKAWDKYWKEEPRFSDRSDLIRKSVERSISSDTDEEDTQDGIGRQEALEQFERLESLLNELDEEVSLVKNDIVDEDTMSNIVLNRSYRSTKRVLETNGVLDNDDSK